MIHPGNFNDILPVTCNTADDVIFANIRSAVARNLPTLELCEPHEGVAVIVGGGPSLKASLPSIRMHQTHGHVIFAVNGTLPALRSADVTPEHFVMLDARYSNLSFLGDAGHYLIASQCPPVIFDNLRGKDVTVWHPAFPGVADVVGREILVIGGGGTVGLQAMSIAYALGYRTIHLYGFDSSYAEGEGHAYPQAQNVGDERETVSLGGKDYIAARWMIRQANEFQTSVKQLVDGGCTVHVHGTGLLPAVWRQMIEGPPLTVLTSYMPSKEFDEEYVYRLRDAVAANLSIPHQFVCLTDHPVDGVACVPLELGLPAHWAKPEMWRPDLPFNRVLFIDLSTVVTGSLDEMASQDGVVMTQDFYHGTPSPSVVLYTVGDFTETWEAFKADPLKYIKLGQAHQPPDFYDQALMNNAPIPEMKFWQDVLPGQLVSYKVHGVPKGCRLVKFHGEPKPRALDWLDPPKLVARS